MLKTCLVPPHTEPEDTNRMFRPEAGWTAAHACDFDPTRPPSIAAKLDSFDAFGRELASRTTPSQEVLARLGRLDKSALAAEAVRTQRAELQLRRILAELIDEPGRVGALLRGIDPAVFSGDYQWRDVLVELQRRPDEYDEQKKLALIKFRQYLLHRRDALDRFWRKAQGAARPRVKASSPNLGSSASLSMTLEACGGVSDGALTKHVRLPRGKAVALVLKRTDRLELRLSAHPFRVVHQQALMLMGEHGQSFRLREGRNMVGRALYNDVVIDAEFGDISRRHVLIEVENGMVVSVTDNSSEGTFVPRDQIAP